LKNKEIAETFGEDSSEIKDSDFLKDKIIG